MPVRLSHRLRHCPVLLVLAACAWMMLVGMAWAQAPHCTAMTGEAATMTGHHHDGGMPCTPAGDCCAHALVALPAASLPAPAGMAFAMPGWRITSPRAPRRARAPPLRPPSG